MPESIKVVYRALEAVFPVVHGEFGRDGPLVRGEYEGSLAIINGKG